ncbi:EAL domain-containing protein [Heliobacterium undosum]|uniref:EAL domain-containing protein n=1 Tax=Heliomicrobium undosum TaxID=121734 RepID=A0A845L561_9FIRM|nr:EAL domain-containing protein [Heliomicrobium undosum]MZP29984.1 EAL domain-containing protein [Heliomicrobium undosum]
MTLYNSSAAGTAKENDLEKALQKQERLLYGVTCATNRLLTRQSFGEAVEDALAILGRAVDVDRVYLFENTWLPDQREWLMSHRQEWCSDPARAHPFHPQLQNRSYRQSGFQRWLDTFLQGGLIRGLVQDFPESEQIPLHMHHKICSLIAVPIFTDDQLWGFIGFDDCRLLRQWTPQEEAALSTVAYSLGGAIKHQRTLDEQKKAEERLRHMASHDFLTGIPNRYHLEMALAQAVEAAAPDRTKALLFVDIDNFNVINDLLGHDVGDRLLIALAAVLRRKVIPPNMVARLGGDEFAVLLSAADEETACQVADELLRWDQEEGSMPVLSGQGLRLTTSVGIVLIDGAMSPQQVLARAGTTMHLAKSMGRGRRLIARADEHGLNRLEKAQQLIDLLKDAAEEGRFSLFFMPIVNLQEGSVRHHEALLRLSDRKGRWISPGEFIPVAENFGLMTDIDRWVVGEALRILRAHPQLELYINISGESLGDMELLQFITGAIRSSGVAPERLGFEITETAVVRDLIKAQQWVGELKKLGCSFAIDDFGNGYSSFSYLFRLPVDYIKIDGAYVRAIEENPESMALVKGINDLAHSLGKRTIAEYVENEQIWRRLKAMGIECGQGYYWGAPRPAIEETYCGWLAGVMDVAKAGVEK